MGVNDTPVRGRWMVGLLAGLACGLLAKELGLRGVVSYWGPQAPVIVIFAVFGALLWRTRARIAVGIVTGLLTALYLVVMLTPLCYQLAKPLVRSDPPAAADAIFVLSSNVQFDDEPSPSALSRATRGLELLGEGRAPRLYLSELGAPAGSYLAYVKRSATRMGVAHVDAIDSVGLVGTTHDEAQAVAALFAEHGWRRLLLVTSPTHSRRSAAAFEKAGVPEVVSVPAVETLVDIEALRHPDDRTFSFGIILHEWMGLLVYRLRGWT